MFLRDRLMGGAGWLPLRAPDDGGGSGAAAGAEGAAGGAAAASGAGSGGAAASAAASGDAGAAGAGAGAGAASVASGAAGAGEGGAAAAGAGAGREGTPVWAQSAPQDWREQLAGEDRAFLSQLKRHTSVKSAFDWLRQTSLKVAAGELREPKARPGEGATEEQLAAWRAENGLPAKATEYVEKLELADGLVPGQGDEPMLERVSQMAFDRGHSQDAVNDFVGLYYEVQQAQQQELTARDQEFHTASEDALRTEMGADFKPNMNALKGFWASAPEVQIDGYPQPLPMAAVVLNARMSDGRVVGDIPGVASWFASVARELNPAAAILPAGGASQQTVDGRISEIEGLMYKDSPSGSGRWGPHYTPALQQEYRELLGAREKIQARGAA